MKDVEPILSEGRLTKKKLIDWLNFQFKKFEINDYEVYEIIQTRYRGQDYEAGAATLKIRFRNKNDHDHNDIFLCFYRISELEMYAKMGYKITLNFNSRRVFTLTNLEIDVIK